MRLLSILATVLVLTALPVAAQTTSAPATEPAGTPAVTGQATPVSPAENMPAPESDLMDAATPDAATIPAATLPHDLSPIGMFLAADAIVKGVMLLLAAASVVTWAILIFKSIEIAVARRRLRLAAHVLTHSDGLRAAADRLTGEGTARTMLQSAADELTKSEAALDHVSPDGVKERVARACRESRPGRQEDRHRHGHSGHHRLHLALCRPVRHRLGHHEFLHRHQPGPDHQSRHRGAGIAEALLATAIGLVAAIPAVVIYNIFSRAIGTYRGVLADARAAVERLVSRDLDMRAASRPRERRTDAGLARIG